MYGTDRPARRRPMARCRAVNSSCVRCPPQGGCWRPRAGDVVAVPGGQGGERRREALSVPPPGLHDALSLPNDETSTMRSRKTLHVRSGLGLPVGEGAFVQAVGGDKG